MKVAIKAHGKYLYRQLHTDGFFAVMFGPFERWAWTSKIEDATLFEGEWCYHGSDLTLIRRLLRRYEPCVETIKVSILADHKVTV